MLINSFFTFNDVPKTGLSPTIEIWSVLPASQTLVITGGAMLEVGDGFYKYDFLLYDPTKDYVFRSDGGVTQPSSERFQYGGTEFARLEVATIDAIADQTWDETATDHLLVGSTGEKLSEIKADTSTLVISVGAITTIVSTLLKFEKNRTRVDPVAKTLTVYDDDCVTPLQVFNLRDSVGAPSVVEVCERSPTPECP